MSKEKVVVAESDGVSAQQVSELFRQIGAGEINGKVIQSIIEHQNPWPHWTKEAYSVSFSVVTNGMTGEEWINHFERKGPPLDLYTKSVLLSKDFKPQKAGENCHVVIVDIRLYGENLRNIKYVSMGSSRHGLRTTSAEALCLIRDNFTNKNLAKMGFGQVIGIHEPIFDLADNPCILGTDGSIIKAHRFIPDDIWSDDCGFVFEG